MSEPTVSPKTPLQAHLAQLALEFAARLEQTANEAPPGTILDACESFLLDRGRQFLRDSLDIYHSSEWLSEAAKAGCGEGTAEAERWLHEARQALSKDGYVGLCEYFGTSAEWVPDRAGLQGSAAEVLNYFCGHRGRLNYALRLRQGLPIGSGLIEGACKQMIGRRMKQTGARWDVKNANRMALLCALAYADALPLYFTAA